MKIAAQRPRGKDGMHTRDQMVCSMKQGHASERIAQRQAAVVAERTGLRIYTYRCRNCKRWHLTKKEQR